MGIKVDLPEFDLLFSLINEIKALSLEVSKLELEIKYRESITFREAKEQGMTVAYTENAYKTTGFKDEILPLRAQLAEKKAELDAKRYELTLYKDIIDVWRSLQANERLGLQ